jgi:threonine/homoserine/homoserine lactone efflux protein
LEIPLFIKGFLIGLAVAMPLGPIGILCIQRTFSEGYLPGLFSGLGISAADAIYGGMAFFGVKALSGFLISEAVWFRLIGGIAIGVMGLRIYGRSRAEGPSPPADPSSCLGAFFSALVLTLMNPALILSFTAIFAGLGPALTTSPDASASMLISGVFSGSAVWWIALSGAVRRLKMVFTDDLIVKINRLSGAVIAGFGLAIIGSALLIK